MTSSPAARTFEARHVQLARAAFAAIAAIMITFSPDHSADIGLSVFSGFAIATGLVFLLAAWLVFPAGARWPSVLMGILSVVAGMIGGVVGIRSVLLFFVLVIAWAFATGLVEAIVGWRGLRQAQSAPRSDASRSDSRDALTVGILTLVLGAALLLVPTQYALEYTIEDAGASFTLTGIIIAVGIFGGYAAIVAVYLAIAGLSPRRVVAGGSAGPVPSAAQNDIPADERGTA